MLKVFENFFLLNGKVYIFSYKRKVFVIRLNFGNDNIKLIYTKKKINKIFNKRYENSL